jgi:serine/threonine-protein kinase
VIIMGSARGLRRIPAAGGTPEPLTRVDSARGEQYHVGPRVLPDGRTVLFIVTRAGGLQNDRLAIVSLETGRSLVLDVSATNALGFVDGHLVIGRADGTIAALPFDLGRWRVTGAAVPLVDGVLVKLNGGVAASAADDGSLVYVRGSSLRKLELVDAQGVSQPGGPAEARRFSHPRFSPDGRRIAVEVEQSTPTQTAWADIWVHDLASGVLSRLTSKQTFAARPEWTPDGRRIAFIAQPTTDTTHGGVVWWVPADGSGPEEPFRVTPKLAVQEITFSPDGRYAILREDTDAPTSRDLWLVPLGDATTTGDTVTRRATRLFETRFTEIGPRVSPDGRWLAYAADESGQYEVYVRPFPGPGGRVQVSSGGGDQPVWAGDGRLVYRSGERFLAAALATPPGVPAASVVDRQVLFAGWYHTDLWRAEYDVRRDGQQLVVLKPAAEDQEVVVVLDWVREFRSRRPAGGPR